MHHRLNILGSLLICLTLLAFTSHAKRLDRQDVPEPLKPWINWVMENDQEQNCPFIYNNAAEHRCAWPTQLNLSLNKHQGEFSILWQVYQDSWVNLPGDQKHWPIGVTSHDQPLTVTNRKGRPVIFLQAGTHAVSGKFAWNHLPDSLSIPDDTGLISLSVNKKIIPSPNINKGQIWIKKRQAEKTNNKEQIRLQVYRNIVDEIPFQVTTQIDLQVSGKQREAIIGKPLLTQAIPINIISQLPARLEPNGQLRVQLRPGRWSITITTRLPDEVSALAFSAQETPWPEAEIWSFSARNHLRLVEIEGVTSIDPRQTQMPDQWRQLPAYRMSKGDTLTFKTIRRGDPEPEPDSLSLQRNLWMDQNGKGFTISDTITGRMTDGWRLEASDQLQLGRVTLDGNPQFITQHSNQKNDTKKSKSKTGVEVRRGAINLQADSRYEEDVSHFNAVGWNHDFQSVNTTLHLPPGWKLFSATGVDKVPDTWLQRWTLLDLFLVLIASVAVSHLWNWRIAILSLITLSLLWHEPGAPRLIWLHIIAAIALLRVLPEGKFRWLVSSYRHLALIGLILISVPFMVDHVRLGLYPQLERAWQSAEGHSPYAINQDLGQTAAVESASDSMIQEEPTKHFESRSRNILAKSLPAPSSTSATAQGARYKNSKFSNRYDTKTNIQTGPGLPHWHWNQVPLNWSGPVEKEQVVQLTLLSPKVNLLLNILRIGLLIALAFAIVRASRLVFPESKTRPPTQTTAVLALLLLIPLADLLYPQDSQAEIPDQGMLEELKKRLLSPPDCLPQCAQMERMALEITPNRLAIRTQIHAVENVMVPLPGSANSRNNNRSHLWSPTIITVAGKPAEALHRDKNGALWIRLNKGSHQLNLLGPLPRQNSLDLLLPLKPPRINLQIKGWDITGLDEEGRPDNQLQLTRLKSDQHHANEKLETGTLPTFVQIHRTLRLGLDWRIETRIKRLSPIGTAVVIKVPLLAGESVLSNSIRVKNDHALINMSPQQSSLEWESSLKHGKEVNLTAADTTEWSEIWYADVSPVWHMESSGVAEVHHQNPNGQWLPEWHPWPGESVQLTISRPEGIPGQTLTIDSSQLTTNPGKRATDVELSLSLRSSQGGQHTLTLPDQVRLQSVTIDGTSQPIRQSGIDNKQVTLPIHPGQQSIKLSWREPEGNKSIIKTPEIDLATPSVNHRVNINLGHDRWVLLTGGPQWGPAVLFWGLLIVIVLAAIGLGRIKLTPLKTWQWLLLGIGLSQAPIFAAFLVVAWLIALGAREKWIGESLSKTNQIALSKTRFNLMQTGLGILTIIALSCLFEAIRQGLLGNPDMQIAGNNSNAYNLNWYQDRISNIPPKAWILSVPLLAYRLLMLAWSLWLAFALLKWLRWGWECFSAGEIWQSFQLRSKPKEFEPPHASDEIKSAKEE